MTQRKWFALAVLVLLAVVLYGCASEPYGGYNIEPGMGPKGSRYIHDRGYQQ